MSANLQKSPLFNLSMASKELFHSNLLFWIGQAYPDAFLKILQALDINTADWPAKWSVYREKNHFDLSVADDHGNYLLLQI